MKPIITAILAVILVAGAQAKDEAERMFKAAQNAELVDGDLKGAIEQYDAIVSKFGKTHRGIAADALVRMAECHSKLGDAEARKLYERVVRDFSDQKEAVAVARARLGSPSPATSANGDRVVWAGENVTHVGGSVSPDGRYVSFTDWWYTGNLMLHDLSSGKDRALTPNKDWRGGGNAGNSTFSRDGKQLAYSWNNWEAKLGEIRIVNPEGTGVPQHRQVFVNEDVDEISPADWSPNGKWLAVHLVRKDRSGQIGIVDVEDGSLRVLKSVGWRGPDKIFFSPDSEYIAYDLPPDDTRAQHDVFVITIDDSSENAAAADPAHDVIMGWSPDGGQLLFASDRTGPASLWALPMADGKPTGAPQLLKPDIGSVSSLGLTASGALHIFKDSSTQALHIAPIDLDTGKLGTPVVESYRAARPDWSRDGKYLAYKKGSLGDLVLAIRNVESGEVREWPMALNYFSEPRWSPNGRWLVAGARDFKGGRAIYRFDAETGAISVIAPGRHTHRVEVSPDGKKIYYGHPEKRGLHIERDLASGETRDVFRRPEQTEIGRMELSPDGRYFAAVSMELAEDGKSEDGDAYGKEAAVLLIPVAEGEPRKLFRVSRPGRLISYAGMSWTPDSRAVVVMKVLGDWGKEHKGELWLVPIDGGEARKLDVDISDWHLGGGYGIRLHPNGRQIAFFAGKQSQEIWALENFLPAQNAAE